MIRYDVDPERLRALVERHKPGWTSRARARTDAIRAKGEYAEPSPIWSEVKPVFLEVQGDAKCCFCERKRDGKFSSLELDIEHFRPKARIRKWPLPDCLRAGDIPLTAPPVANRGYHLLSYHLLNYAAACKPCNSGFKKDYFPIAGEYDLGGEDPREMDAEQPWLLYPIGRLDLDPEEVITFHGILPQSQSADPISRMRGLVTIVFFGLDDVIARKDLMRERAQIVLLLFFWLEKAGDAGDAGANITSMLAPTAPHANCARSFVRLFRSDRARATEVAEAAERFLQTGSP